MTCLQRMKSVVDVTHEQLSEAKRQWVDGTRKNELVSWWLDAIEEKVLAFLDKLYAMTEQIRKMCSLRHCILCCLLCCD